MKRSTIRQFVEWVVIIMIVVYMGTARAEENTAVQSVVTGTQGKSSNEPQPGTILAKDIHSEQPNTAGGSTGESPNSGESASSEKMPWLIPHLDYRGDLLSRPALIGDCGGLRQQLMDKGLRFDINLTQTLQDNVAGGKEEGLTYQEGFDFGFRLDTGHAGLWPGGLLVARGEARYGKSNNLKTGALMPVNTDSLFPVPEDDVVALSELYYMQFLTPWVGILAGKLSFREKNVFAHDETAQFMNTAFNFDPVLGTTIPLSTLGAGVVLLPAEWFNITTLVVDSEGRADSSGFDTVFNRGTSLAQIAEFAIKPFGLPGHQRVGWTWSDRQRIQFQQDFRVVIGTILTGNTSLLSREDKDGSFFYDFDQYVYLAPGTKDRGLGVFGRFGLGDEDVNPIGSFYSLGIGGKGLIPGRETDTFGAGFYYAGLSDKLPRIIKRFTQNEQGVEVYYNISITPWMHITPDIQIIDPARESVATTVVAGIRMKIDF